MAKENRSTQTTEAFFIFSFVFSSIFFNPLFLLHFLLDFSSDSSLSFCALFFMKKLELTP